jgi:hypothetical protein
MTGNHVSFEMMSDLFDGLVDGAEERELLRAHIKSCPVCSLEYGRLEKTVRLCRLAVKAPDAPADFSLRTLARIKRKGRTGQYLRSLPAIAASLLIIVGFALFGTGPRDVAVIGDGATRGSRHESERVLDIIRKHNATISQVTEAYVEGTVPAATFEDMRRSLGQRRVAYMPAGDADLALGEHWGNAVEEVGLGEGQTGRVWAPLRDHGSPGGLIRFRVYR